MSKMITNEEMIKLFIVSFFLSVSANDKDIVDYRLSASGLLPRGKSLKKLSYTFSKVTKKVTKSQKSQKVIVVIIIAFTTLEKRYKNVV